MSQSPLNLPYGYVRPLVAPARVLPRPPRLHWGFVLLFMVVTLGLFAIVWLLVQANWVRRVRGKSTAFWWAMAYLLYIPAAAILGGLLGVIAVLMKVPVEEMIVPAQTIVRLAAFVIALGTIFTLRNELESEPINLTLSGFMTLFFSTIYFQYHLTNFVFGGGSMEVSSTLGLSGGMPPPLVETREVTEPLLPPSSS